MPQNADRNGVKSSINIVTSATSGKTRCQLDAITCASFGIKFRSTPFSFSRLASKCTIIRHAR